MQKLDKLELFIDSTLCNECDVVERLKVFQNWLIVCIIIQFGIGFKTWDTFSGKSMFLSRDAVEAFMKHNDVSFFLNFIGLFNIIYIGIFLLSIGMLFFKKLQKGIIFLFLGNLILLQINYLYDIGDKIILNYWLFFLSLSYLSNRLIWKKIHLLLIQLQLGIIYLFGALTKVSDPVWWRGEGLVHLIEREKELFPFLESFSNFTSLLYFINFLVIFFELSFFFFSKHPYLKRSYFLFGAIFHIMVILLLGHLELSLMFLVVYVTYFPEIRSPQHYVLKILCR